VPGGAGRSGVPELQPGDVPPADLFGPDVHFALEAVGDREAELLPEEAYVVQRAVERRRRQFAAGRVLARRLLAQLGHAPAPLLPGPDRRPLWPAGVVGTLAHTEEHVAVAVAPAATAGPAPWPAPTGAAGPGPPFVPSPSRSAGGLRSLGLDVERRQALEPDLWPTVLRPDERAWLDEQPAESRGQLATLVFCVKECVYKVQYPLSRRVLEFHDVGVRLTPLAGRFEASVPEAVAAALGGGTLRGRLHVGETCVLAAAELR